MLPLNAYVIKSRGHLLNWGVDFRGGSEILIEFSQARSTPARSARRWPRSASTTPTSSSTRTRPARSKWNYLVRVGAVSVVSEQQAKQIRESLAKVGDATPASDFEWSEGGDKIYLRYDKPVEPTVLAELAQGDRRQHRRRCSRFGRAEDNTYEVTLVGLDSEIRRALDTKLGAGAVAAIPQVESVGAKAGKQLQ